MGLARFLKNVYVEAKRAGSSEGFQVPSSELPVAVRGILNHGKLVFENAFNAAREGIDLKMPLENVGSLEAINSTESAYLNALMGFRSNGKSFSNAIFVGTSADVTKTAEGCSEILFNDKRHTIKFDMAQYSTAESAKEFIDQLKKALKKPYGVVLFENAGSAHRLAQDAFIVQMERSAFSTSEVSSKTSYIFGVSVDAAQEALAENGDLREVYNTVVSNSMRPELRARMDFTVIIPPSSGCSKS